MKPYGDLTAEEREAAWREAERVGGAFASPPGFYEWSFSQQPAPPYRPTPKRLRRRLRGHP